MGPRDDRGVMGPRDDGGRGLHNALHCNILSLEYPAAGMASLCHYTGGQAEQEAAS